MRAGVLIWLQPQLCQRDEALHASTEGDERAVLPHASHVAMRALPDFYCLQWSQGNALLIMLTLVQDLFPALAAEG